MLLNTAENALCPTSINSYFKKAAELTLNLSLKVILVPELTLVKFDIEPENVNLFDELLHALLGAVCVKVAGQLKVPEAVLLNPSGIFIV